MSDFDYIIPLGQTCNITFLLQNCKIKKETTLFEWFVTNNLKKISNVLYKIGKGEDINIKQKGQHIYMEDSDIFTGHYSMDEFIPIFKRRSERLKHCIQTNTRILFVRFDRDKIKYTKEDIDTFIDSIKTINPNIENMRLLLITPNKEDIIHPYLINKSFISNYETIYSDPYYTGELVNTFFEKLLKDIGYNMSQNEMVFHDKSIN